MYWNSSQLLGLAKKSLQLTEARKSHLDTIQRSTHYGKPSPSEYIHLHYDPASMTQETSLRGGGGEKIVRARIAVSLQGNSPS